MPDFDPLDAIHYRFQAEGVTYKREALVISLIVWSWIIAGFIILTLISFFLWILSTISKGCFGRWEKFWYWCLHLSLVGVILNIPILLLFGVVFDEVNVAIGIVFSFLFIALCWLLICPLSIFAFLRKKLRPDAYDKSMKQLRRNFLLKPIKHPIWFWLGLIAIFLFSFLLNFFLEDVCLSTSPVDISFKRTRGSDSCKEGDVCLLFLTFGDQMATGMIVNFHTRRAIEKPLVYYDTRSRKGKGLDSYRFQASGNSIEMELEEERHIHWVDLLDLQPDTVYFFRAGGKSHEGHIWFSEERWFRTAPLQEPFTFATGGDVGARAAAVKLIEISRKHDILFFAIGGDIAYETGMRSCYKRMDDWVRLYDKHSSDDERMIPLFLALGNHEGGFLVPSRDELPFYFHYFPQQYGLHRKDLLDRSSYFPKYFGEETQFMVLDSGHLVNPKNQVEFIKSELEENSERNHKLAFYHIPMFLGSEVDYDFNKRRRLRRAWRDLFEAKELDIVFQFHDHVYARTNKVKDDDEYPINSVKGTAYLNVGCMGVKPVNDKKRSDHYVILEEKEHVLIVEVSKTQLKVRAFDPDGKVFDEYVINSPN